MGRDEVGGGDVDRVTSVDEFNCHKRALCAVLRSKADPLPFLIQPGALLDESASMAMGRKLDAMQEAGGTAKLLRGYRLLTVPAIGTHVTFNAVPALVILKSDGTKETDHYNGVLGSTKPFVFVPSSRMHAELSDDAICSGRHMLCTVVVGCRETLNTLRMMRDILSFFQQRKLCMKPEEGIARKWLLARPLPFFDIWFKYGCNVCPSFRIDIHVAFGFSFRALTDSEHELAIDSEVPDEQKVFSTTGYTLRELVQPTGLWKTEPRIWLPTVKKLHDFYRVSSSNYTVVPGSNCMGTYVEFYKQLLSEYWARLRTNDGGGLAIPGGTSATFR